jgi:hypothetical protein
MMTDGASAPQRTRPRRRGSATGSGWGQSKGRNLVRPRQGEAFVPAPSDLVAAAGSVGLRDRRRDVQVVPEGRRRGPAARGRPRARPLRRRRQPRRSRPRRQRPRPLRSPPVRPRSVSRGPCSTRSRRPRPRPTSANASRRPTRSTTARSASPTAQPTSTRCRGTPRRSTGQRTPTRGPRRSARALILDRWAQGQSREVASGGAQSRGNSLHVRPSKWLFTGECGVSTTRRVVG